MVKKKYLIKADGNIKDALRTGKIRFSCISSDMKPFDKDSQFSKKIMGIKVYTTETYDDIINAYKKSHTIDLAKQKIKK